MKTIRRNPVLIALALLNAQVLLLTHSAAQPPPLLNYQGRVTVDGTNFHGTGEFRFALVDGAGTTHWSNDGNSPPNTSVSLSVDQGLYFVLLGDTSLTGMDVAIDPSVFANPAIYLRVWFDDGVSGFAQLTPDQRLVPVGYAMMAGGVHSDGDIVGRRLNMGTGHTLSGNWATISGGEDNEASALYATIGGGRHHTAGGVGATIGGGWGNLASGATSTIGGGIVNVASGNDSTVGGGLTNTASGFRSTVSGGQHNTASGSRSTVGGGWDNFASGLLATVGGGADNIADGQYSAVPGGRENLAAGNYSFAAGRRAQASHQGAFVWADSENADFESTTHNEFAVRAAGGLRLVGGAFIGDGSGLTNLNVSTQISGDVEADRLNIGTDHTLSGDWATIAGGAENEAIGLASSIGGGGGNIASEMGTTISGGSVNRATGEFATVVGGFANTAGGAAATVAGGSENIADGDYSFAAGRRASANHDGAFVWADSGLTIFESETENEFAIRAAGGLRLVGGTFIGDGSGLTNLTISGDAISGDLEAGRLKIGNGHTLTGFRATIAGGQNNQATANNATVSGGQNNLATGWRSMVGGGEANHASANYAAIGGGWNNHASHEVATIGGGRDNIAAGPRATVSGGLNNRAAADRSTVGGGWNNSASGTVSTVSGGSANVATTTSSTIGGGSNNRVDGAQGTVGGGQFNTASGPNATVPGGRNNEASGNDSFAAGRNAKALHTGSFVWADGQAGDFESQANNEFAIRASGGMRVEGGATVATLTITGGADISEPFPMSEDAVSKGSVVVIDPHNPGALKVSQQPYDRRVAGIVSGANGINPGVVLSQEGRLEGDELVALSGRVYVQADASHGPIEPGDLLTTSPTRGHAMRVTDYSLAQGATLGKAMTGLEDGTGMVLVLVTLQ